MKATKFYITVSLVLMMAALGAIRANALTLNGIDPGTSSSNKNITYVVGITPADFLLFGSSNYYVTVTDERGNPVGGIQPFRYGQWTYIFHESGQALGSRTARMVFGGHFSAPRVWYVLPETMPGPFDPGNSYSFTLTPQRLSTGENH